MRSSAGSLALLCEARLVTPPPVSIVIPAHNAGAWIAACVESCLAQRQPPVEIIVVDDHSTDDTVARLAPYRTQGVTLLTAPTRGGNAARNQGARVARGEWIQFLDADDYLEPAKVGQQLDEAGDLSNVDVLYSPIWTETWRNGRAVDRTATPLDVDTDVFTQWITWQLPQTGGGLWRRDALLAIGGWKENQPCCQEHELYLRALREGLTFRYCPSRHAVYRIWSEETVCRKDPVRVIRERTALIDAALRWLTGQGTLQRGHQQAAARAGFEMARTWAKYDLAAAAAYYAERNARGLILPTGPAAPALYQLVLRSFGFVAAEKIARRRRTSAADTDAGVS